MKVRWITFGALLLALFVSPSAARASMRSLGVSTCQTPKPLIGSIYRGNAQAPSRVAFSIPGHQHPAPRLHRIRGKRINMQPGFTIAQGCPGKSCYVFAGDSARLQDAKGPNPSRGPPAQISL
jgi:hypothetical protein